MTDDRVPEANRPPAAVLAEAAEAAGYAPSVHNTQPWRWRVEPEALDLFAERSRQLRVTDPDGRLLTISCGTALHNARVALAAEGWTCGVARFPDPHDPDYLARVTLAGRAQVTPEAMRLFQAVRVRHTDRRPISDIPASAEAISAIRAAAAAEQINVHQLTRDQIIELAVAAGRAEAAGVADPAQREEMGYWIGRGRPEGAGIPESVIPERRPQTTVPTREFAVPGTLPISAAGHDRAAVYLLLFGEDDEPGSWLRAGEALSAGWLVATELGLSVLPLSSAIEVAGTRETLWRMLAGLGYPYLVLRLGMADPNQPGPPHTPRLPAAQVVDTSAVTRQPGH